MSSQTLSKVAVAIGGFLIFVGIIMIGMFALTISGLLDIGVLETISENEAYQTLFFGALLVIGILDLLSGIMLRRR